MQTRCPGVAEKNYLKTENNFEALLIEFAVVLTATCGSQRVWVGVWVCERVHICGGREHNAFSFVLCKVFAVLCMNNATADCRNMIRDFDISAKILALCCAGIRDLFKLKLKLKQNKWLQWEIFAVTASENDFRWRSFSCKPHTCTECLPRLLCLGNSRILRCVFICRFDSKLHLRSKEIRLISALTVWARNLWSCQCWQQTE